MALYEPVENLWGTDKYVTLSFMSRTYNPKKGKRKKAHGFLGRQSTVGGKNTLKRRRAKGRHKLTV